jgi:lactate dehydrogenase-like 2-hydroxyacid dehydrogenase
MKIVILDAKTLGATPNLGDISKFGELTIFESTSSDQRIERIKDADIIITNKVLIDAYVMDHCPDLKLVCISATGMNNVDLVTAEKKGLKVMNAAGYSSGSVAQHTFAMLLQLTNQISYYDQYVKSGKYTQSDIFTHYGPTIFELRNKNYGIIGMGNIGRTVASIAQSFGAHVCYYSTSGKNTGQDFPALNLEELLKTSDIISIHAPLNEKTKNLIGKDQLAMMQSHAILINVGRGGIVNEKELANAIDRRLIGGACIDVFEQEPIDEKNPLLSVQYPERLVLSPHNAWASIEARTRLVEIIMENIKTYLGLKT